MKKAALILVIIGTVASLLLGIVWLSDYNDTKDMVNSAKDLVDSVGGASDEFNDAVSTYDNAGTSSYALIIGGVLAFAAFLLSKKIGKTITGLILLVIGIVPGIFAPKAFVATAAIIIAGILTLLAKDNSNTNTVA